MRAAARVPIIGAGLAATVLFFAWFGELSPGGGPASSHEAKLQHNRICVCLGYLF
jgi:hypothetical protein